MDSNNEKKSKRPRIGQPSPSAAAQAESLAAQASNNTTSNPDTPQQSTYQSYGYQRPAGTIYPRQQYPHSNYQQRPYGQQAGGYPHSNYQPRPYGQQPAAEGTDSAQNTDSQQGGYQPRPRYQQGGYQPRQQGGYNNRQGGYNNNRQGGYQPRQQRPGGYQPRPYGQQPATEGTDSAQNTENMQGGYQPRPRYQQGGYQPRQQGGYNNNRQGGYNNNRQGGYNNNRQQGGYNNNRQGGYNNRQQGGYHKQGNRPYGQQQGQPRQNRFGMPQGGKSFIPRAKRIEYELPAPDPDAQVRLNKYMANAGICSRREADEFIRQGLVKVNGEVVTELGTKITCKDTVEYDDKVVTLERKTYILLNKPKDCVTTSDDPHGRTTVLDLVKGACDERIYPVGRLDRNTTGVLLLTNDGDLASKLTHPKYVKKKIYHVWVDKDIAEEDMQAIADGIELDDGPIHADAISYATETDRNQAGIEIHSGRNRIVRRIFEKLGYHVTKLDRVYFAGLTKKNLPRGRWRYLTQEEVNFLKMGAFEQ